MRAREHEWVAHKDAGMSFAPVQDLSEVAKTGSLLGAIIVHNLLYPLSGAGTVGPIAFYIVYASMYGVGTWLLTPSPAWRVAAAVSGLATFAAGLANSFATSSATELMLFLSSIAYHVVMIVVLARYTFGARIVMTEVVLAATSLYLILGSMFAAVFAVILWLDPGAFVAGTGEVVKWQQLLYYSYVTFTTLGYGDILPASFYAQSMAAFVAICGTLYSVLLLSRLVGLHAARQGPVRSERSDPGRDR